MADRFRVFATVSLCALFACAPDPHDPHPGEARLLDRACSAPDGCTIAGDARRTSGLTSDSVGFRLEAGASLDVAVPTSSFAISGDDVWHDEVLVSGSGRITIACDGAPCGDGQASSDFVWLSTHTQATDRDTTTPNPAGALVPAHHLTITASSGSVDVVDVRVVTTQSYHGCD
jgi:hypothetical protein